MLKLMKCRFIAAAMSAVTIVVVILLVVINAVHYRNVTFQQDDIIKQISEKPANMAPPDFRPRGGFDKFSPEFGFMLRYFAVHFNEDMSVDHVDKDFIASVSEDEIVSYANAVIKKNNEKGYYGNYRYLCVKNEGKTSVFFLNCERELANLKSLLALTAIIAFIVLALVFGLLLIVSRRAIAPYVRNIETQKKFITDAGHELKTPLSSISASADILEMSDGENEWVQNIKSQVNKMSHLVADLITLSRLDEEKPFHEMTEFSLTDAIWEVAEPMRLLADAKGKTLNMDTEEGLLIKGDMPAIQQMISILLDNAIKYSDDNGKISLSAKRHHRKVIVKVENTCNLPDTSKLDHLFDRFYRMDDSRAEKTGGYGIGLSIAQAIVNSHGGKISVHSADGTNIEFTVVL